MTADPRWKSTLLRKGMEVARQLEALLAGKEADLGSLPVWVSPSADPELRLRRFLELIDRAIKSFGADAYGRCAICAVDLDGAVLAEQPWLAACPAHMAQLAG